MAIFGSGFIATRPPARRLRKSSFIRSRGTGLCPRPTPGAQYVATLGYFDPAKNGCNWPASAATVTPLDSVAEDTAVRFATIPADVPFAQLLSSVQAAVRENVPLALALQELRAEGFSSLPEPAQIPGPWTPAQEKALAEIVMMDDSRRIWIGSLEVTELIRRELQHEISSIMARRAGAWPALPPRRLWQRVQSVRRPERRRGFWFNVNAELVVYGSTEPDASVTIGGRPIQLRRDGSFSFRFALPDGSYGLPVAARPANGEETRQAELNFSRASQYQGEVQADQRDETLQPPSANAVT